MAYVFPDISSTLCTRGGGVQKMKESAKNVCFLVVRVTMEKMVSLGLQGLMVDRWVVKQE